jgi:hypothetical protein
MSRNLADIPVSLFDGSYDSHPQRTVTLAYVLESIRTGRYARQIRAVRQILATKGKSAYDTAKRSLPAVTFGGTFDPTRGNDHLQQHTGIAHGDLDHIPDMLATKIALCDDPSTVYVFTSPSGTGLKVGLRIPPVADDAAYKHAWHAVRVDCERRYGVQWDLSGKDIARLCYVSYAPDIYINFNAEVFDVPPMPTPTPKPSAPRRHASVASHPDRRRTYAQRAVRTAVQMVDSAPDGTRHEARLKAARLLGGYVASGVLSETEAYDALEQAVRGNTDHLSGALRTIADGLRYGQADPIDIDALEAERQEWLRQHVIKSPPRQPSPVPPQTNPWDGMRTLPIRPFARHRGIHIRGRQVRDG